LDGSLIVVYGIKFVKRTHDPKHWQRPPRLPHRHMNMFVPSRTNFLMVLSAALSFACLPAFAQLAGVSATPVGTPITTSAIVQPALADVQSCISGLNIARWKAPNEVRNAAQQNAASIQRDLTNTLPSLLSQVDASPGVVPPAFSLYRNIDALYDVLLRVYETASLAAPQNELDAVYSALQKLEAARTQLGDAILNASQEREAQLVKLQAALQAAATVQAPATPAKTAVVDDGPATTPPVKKKKKPPAKPPASGSTAAPAPGG